MDQIWEPEEYAVIRETPRDYLYGAKATINVWDPEIEGDEMSIAQMWIAAGKYETGNLNTIEVGCQVLPRMYLDNKPRLFVFWTSDSYKHGCYNLKCSGFIQTSSSIVIGGSITPVSSFGGSQYEITILVWRDRISGNWWLSLGSNSSVIGYWPGELFTTLADHAVVAEWGGEILNSASHGQHTKTQMGSGHFPAEGFRNSSYFRNIEMVDKNNSLQTVQDYEKLVTQPECYDIKTAYTDEWKSHFYYGGPGFRSGAVTRVVDTRLWRINLDYHCLSRITDNEYDGAGMAAVAGPSGFTDLKCGGTTEQRRLNRKNRR
ncbi:unnamed protein product [Microthlaspi erraticum]|uniref:Neprosin PEP catalytic domain-containing protein n=1 Tax=Microthlaspi erraticum TaxID=1685480 RepID=A0A6D2IGF4_9BRAS|nr:unnamed protein product [Microthlaspi erraticum]